MMSRLIPGLFLALATIGTGQTPVTITTVPTGVKVVMDGEKLGVSPINNQPISNAVHRFELKLENHALVAKSLEIHPARHLHLEFRLNPIHPVVFKSAVDGLSFSTGGFTWEGKKARLKMEAGRHRVYVSAGKILTDSLVINVSGPLEYKYDPR